MIATGENFNPVITVVRTPVGLAYCKSGGYGITDKDIV